MPVLRFRILLATFLLGLAPMVAGCEIADDLVSGTKSKLPDEFQVMNQPPLSLPPDYGLQPPRPGAERPSRTEPTESARQAVFGIKDAGLYRSGDVSAANWTIGERALLTRAGANRAEPGIRRILNDEATAIAPEDRSLTEKLLFMGAEDTSTDEMLNPGEEYRRIHDQPAPTAPDTETPKDDETFGYE